MADSEFWLALDRLVATSNLIIDRPKGSPHPRHTSLRYPMDYGYLQGTKAPDGDGIDVWIGSLRLQSPAVHIVTGIIATVDSDKRDAEFKLLLNCTPAEAQIALAAHNRGLQTGILVARSGKKKTMNDRNNIFQGELVRLVAPSERAAPVLARWTEDADYLRAVDSDYARPLSAEQAALRLNPEEADPNKVEFHFRTLADDRLIGFVALHSIEWNNGAGLLAIGIGEPQYRGKGYGTDALHLILRYAFQELNLFRIGLDVIATNPRAIHTYEKLGFQHEGCMRGAVLRDGRRTDRIFMGILRDEWVEHQQGAPV